MSAKSSPEAQRRALIAVGALVPVFAVSVAVSLHLLLELLVIFGAGCGLVAVLVAVLFRLYRKRVIRRAGAAAALRGAGEGGEAA